MATSLKWKLKRFARFVRGSGETEGKSWKVFEANGNKPEIFLTILESGVMLVLQGQESLDSTLLVGASDSVKAYQKSDNLMFQFDAQRGSRMTRMQFDGSSRAEAIKECSSAVQNLTKYLPVIIQRDVPLAPNQTPTEVTAPVTQEKVMEVEPESAQGSLSIKRLTQHFLGEAAVILPQVYQHASLAPGEMESFLRMCLLDPSFHGFVELVEGELKKLLIE